MQPGDPGQGKDVTAVHWLGHGTHMSTAARLEGAVQRYATYFGGKVAKYMLPSIEPS